MFLLHLFFTWLATKSIKFRKALNGKPVIVVTPDGIDSEAMAKLNFTVNDLLESIRSQQYFSVEQIKYAVLETNGNLSVMVDESADTPESIPVTLVVEGKKMEDNYSKAAVNEAFVDETLTKKGLNLKDVVLFSKTDNKIFIQPRGKKYISEKLNGGIENADSGTHTNNIVNGAKL